MPKQVDIITEDIPSDWNIPMNLIKNKLVQLFELKWTEKVWDNFEECLNDNI